GIRSRAASRGTRSPPWPPRIVPDRVVRLRSRPRHRPGFLSCPAEEPEPPLPAALASATISLWRGKGQLLVARSTGLRSRRVPPSGDSRGTAPGSGHLGRLLSFQTDSSRCEASPPRPHADPLECRAGPNRCVL